MDPLSRSDRRVCWTARDNYFSCLDKNNILSTRQPTMNELLETINRAPAPPAASSTTDPTANGKPPLPKECAELLKEFRSKCLSSWVRYFHHGVSCFVGVFMLREQVQHFEQTRERQKIMQHLESRTGQQKV